MAIYKTAINKPITTGLIFVAVIVLGLFSLSRLPIDQMPEMDPPYVTVMTTYAGANASEIETNITKLVENSLNSVDGLKNITSTSKDNISVVSLEFEWGSNIDEALNDIRSYVDLLYDNLPDGVSRPMILKLNSRQHHRQRCPRTLRLHRPRPQATRCLRHTPRARRQRNLCQQPRPCLWHRQDGQGAVPNARQR